MSPLEYSEKTQQQREACINLRIGLNMLGEEGRNMLIQYIKAKLEGKNPASSTIEPLSSTASLQVSI